LRLGVHRHGTGKRHDRSQDTNASPKSHYWSHTVLLWCSDRVSIRRRVVSTCPRYARRSPAYGSDQGVSRDRARSAPPDEGRGGSERRASARRVGATMPRRRARIFSTTARACHVCFSRSRRRPTVDEIDFENAGCPHCPSA
jgi:hypothetical protein